MKRLFLAAALLFSGALPAWACQASVWTLEEGSSLGFVASQAGAGVEGLFDRFQAEICFDPDRLDASSVAVEIDMGSVNSQSTDRDGTIRSAALFDVTQWPSARFEVERFTAAADGGYEAHARLTMRDATLEVVLPFQLEIADHPDDPSHQQAHATGALTVLRLDYGIGQGQWQDTSMVANEVVIRIDILAKRPKV